MAIKNQSYAGLCESWVEDVTNSSIQGDTAYDSWKNLSSKGKGITGLNGVQPGDLVYFGSDPNSAYGTDGHVGIYNGNGLFTSATDNGVATANIQNWTKTNNQTLLGYVPRKNLSQSPGAGGGSMAGVNPGAIVKIKDPQGQEMQVKVSDLPAYGLSADSIPSSAYISGAPNNGAATVQPATVKPAGGGQNTPPSANPGGGIAGSGVTGQQLVGNAIAGQNAGNVQKQNEAAASANAPTLSGQNVQMNANDLAKQSLQLQEEAFQKDATLAPEVLKLDLAPQNGKPGMTLEHAMSKYGQFMKPADIFSMYNETNGTGQPGTWGPAKNTVAQLQQMGFNDIPKAVQDKQDSISAINLIRSLRDSWNQYRANPTDFTAKKNYEAIKNTLVDPSTNYGKLVAQYRNSFPDPNNPTTWIGADGGFKGVEQVVLDQSGGQTYKSLGLNDPYQNQQNSSNPLGGLLGGAMGALKGNGTPGKTVKDVGKFLLGATGDVLNPQIDAANKTIQSTNQALKDNKGNPLGAASQATANEVGNVAGVAPTDAATAATMEAPGLLTKGASKLLKPFMDEMAARSAAKGATKEATTGGSKLFKTLKNMVTNPTKGGLYKNMQKTVKGTTPVYKNASDTARKSLGDAGIKQKQNLERWISHFEPKSDTGVLQNKRGPSVDIKPTKGITGITKEDRSVKFDKRMRKGETRFTKRGIPDYLTKMAKNGSKPLRESTPTEQTKTVTNAKWTGSKALEARGELTRKMPSALQKTFGRGQISAEDEASIKALQRGISQEIKRVAPEMKSLDNLYRFYAKFGSPAKIIGTAAAVQLLDKAPIPDPVKKILEPLVSAPEGLTILRGL